MRDALYINYILYYVGKQSPTDDMKIATFYKGTYYCMEYLYAYYYNTTDY